MSTESDSQRHSGSRNLHIDEALKCQSHTQLGALTDTFAGDACNTLPFGNQPSSSLSSIRIINFNINFKMSTTPVSHHISSHPSSISRSISLTVAYLHGISAADGRRSHHLKWIQSLPAGGTGPRRLRDWRRSGVPRGPWWGRLGVERWWKCGKWMKTDHLG